MMGSPKSEKYRDDDEGPQRRVTFAKPFAVGKFEVTWDEWDACVRDGGCNNGPVEKAGGDNGWGKGRRPVIEVNWEDAKAYAAWLSKKTGKPYRLLTEAEWEYAARAGTTTAYFWGDRFDTSRANNGRKTVEVGRYRPNAWGVHDMHGNVWEWTEDCWNDSYKGAPVDGSAWTSRRMWSPCCSRRFLGRPFQTCSARPTASGTAPATGTTGRVSGSGGRLPLDALSLYHWGPGRSSGRYGIRLRPAGWVRVAGGSEIAVRWWLLLHPMVRSRGIIALGYARDWSERSLRCGAR